jgi:hypothetical protein
LYFIEKYKWLFFILHYFPFSQFLNILFLHSLLLLHHCIFNYYLPFYTFTIQLIFFFCIPEFKNFYSCISSHQINCIFNYYVPFYTFTIQLIFLFFIPEFKNFCSCIRSHQINCIFNYYVPFYTFTIQLIFLFCIPEFKNFCSCIRSHQINCIFNYYLPFYTFTIQFFYYSASLNSKFFIRAFVAIKLIAFYLY